MIPAAQQRPPQRSSSQISGTATLLNGITTPYTHTTRATMSQRGRLKVVTALIASHCIALVHAAPDVEDCSDAAPHRRAARSSGSSRVAQPAATTHTPTLVQTAGMRPTVRAMCGSAISFTTLPRRDTLSDAPRAKAVGESGGGREGVRQGVWEGKRSGRHRTQLPASEPLGEDRRLRHRGAFAAEAEDEAAEEHQRNGPLGDAEGPQRLASRAESALQ